MKKKNEKKTYICVEGLTNVRKAPSMSAEILKVMTPADAFILLDDKVVSEDDYEWYKIDAGYIRKDFVKIAGHNEAEE